MNNQCDIYLEIFRQMHVEFSLYQIEMLLGLHDEIKDPSSQWLKGYEHLFDKKHLAPDFDSKACDPETKYVDKRLTQTRFRWTSRWFSWVLLFGPFIAFGVLFILLAFGSGKNQKATTKDAPTKQSLPTVNLSQAPNAGQINADTSDKKNPPPTDWIVWFTGALVFVGITQVVVYFVQARYMRTGLKLTRQAANAAGESAKVATRQTSIMASRERPWIMVKPDWPLPDTENPFGGPVEWSATNVGRSPAFLTKLVALADVVAYPIPDKRPEYPQPEPFAKFIIPPNGNHGSKAGAALDASQLQNIFDGKQCLLFYGFIDYNDTLGDPHQTRFCCIWRMKSGEWLFEPVGPPSYIDYT